MTTIPKFQYGVFLYLGNKVKNDIVCKNMHNNFIVYLYLLTLLSGLLN